MKTSAKRVFTLLDMEEEENPAQMLENPPRGDVEFSYVDFAYQPEEPLIQDLNLSVRPGQNVAIVGPTGAGKTTIVNLLMRFYDPVQGQIVEQGTHREMMARRGFYYTLYTSQYAGIA